MTQPKTFQVGQAAVTVINIGELQADLTDWFNIPKQDWPAQYAPLYTQQIRVPVQCIHVALPEASLLIDAGAYDFPSDSSMLIPGYQPPPALTSQLADIGVQPEMISHVIITHAHFDHYNGVTRPQDGQLLPTFPNARHYLARPDWERAELQTALHQADSPQSRTLGILFERGLLTLVDGNLDLGHGIEIVATPGESPGHQVARVRSAGQSLYCIGDLYHHPLEFEQVDWSVTWADLEANRASRQALIEAALAEEALIIATHIPTIYRLRQGKTRVEWLAV
jgi:glyoxylase-like metal-dependent hydrolase (beta-lactamase superfamily II)